LKIFNFEQIVQAHIFQKHRVKRLSWLLHAFVSLNLLFFGIGCWVLRTRLFYFGGAKAKTQERPKSLLEPFGAFWAIVLGTKSTKQLWRVLLKQ
jgi:hypothetical protein